MNEKRKNKVGWNLRMAENNGGKLWNGLLYHIPD
jgi:hypothetical protein